MTDNVLEKLREQLAMYEDMARKEKENTGGETFGTCAYLEGAIVASQRAVEIVERMRGDLDLITLQVAPNLHGPLEASLAWEASTLAGRDKS